MKHGDKAKLIYQIENGRIRPSKMLTDSLGRMLKGNQEFVLVDDQKLAPVSWLSSPSGKRDSSDLPRAVTPSLSNQERSSRSCSESIDCQSDNSPNRGRQHWRDTMEFGPLDSVITGYAYETATSALGKLEGGQGAPGFISTEMLCALDNLIKVVLFSDRVFIHNARNEIKVAPDGIRVDVGDVPLFGASAATKSIFDAEGIFYPLPMVGAGDTPEKSLKRVEDALKVVKASTHPVCTLQATWPGESTVLSQEMHVYDVAFIEAIIHQCGVGRFKPVFPGEHLYIGLRGEASYSQSIADLAARRLRSVIREKLKALNERHQTLGALPLPEVPPMFLLRVLADSPVSGEIASTLFKIRRSASFARFRQCVAECHRMLESADISAHEKAEKVVAQFRRFEFQAGAGGGWIKRAFGVVKALFAASGGDLKEPAEEIFELSTMLYKSLGRHPLLALEEFHVRKADPKKLDSYLHKKFGDKFNLGEMHSVAMLLALPETSTDWDNDKVSFQALATRADSAAPINSRPVIWRTKDHSAVTAAQQAFDKMVEQAVPFALILELVNSGVPQEKIDELMAGDDAVNRIERLRKEVSSQAKSPNK